MTARQYPLLFLCLLSVAGCSPRFTVQDGTDPRNGVKAPIRLDTRTGESTILRVMEPLLDHPVYFWEPVHDQRTAMAVLKAYQNATNSPSK